MSTAPRLGTALLALAASGLLAASQVSAQQMVLSKEDYLRPPQPLADILDSHAMHNRDRLTNLGPDGVHFLLSRNDGMPGLERFARPYVNLGETAIDHVANRSRRLSTGATVRYELMNVETGEMKTIEVPDGMTVAGASWSPDGSHVAFMANDDMGSYLWVAEVATGNARPVTDRALNATLVTSLSWSGDGKSIFAVLIPEGRGAMPQKDPVAQEPTVWLSKEGETPSRTYRFLLKTPFDMELLEYLTTGQLAKVDVDSGAVEAIGQPAMFQNVSAAPDGQSVRVTTMQKPFSYFVPMRSFGNKDELWNLEGSPLAMISERELQDGNNNGRNGNGDRGDQKRAISWRPDGNGVSFLMREPRPEKEKKGKTDGDDAAPRRRSQGRRRGGARTAQADGAEGDKKEEPKRKDRVMQWVAPYGKDDMKVVWESDDPIGSVQYSADCQTLFVTQTKDGKRHVFAVDLAQPDQKKMIAVTEVSQSNDPFARFRRRGGAGGTLMSKAGPMGGRVVRTSTDGKHVYTSGQTDPEKDETSRPLAYVDRHVIGDPDGKERIWQAAEDMQESMQAVLDDDFSRMVVSREDPTTVPDSWLVQRSGGQAEQLTHNEDPAPAVTNARRERFQVTRVDGMKFWVNVTIPQGYGERLPALFWFYPREFTSQKQYEEGVRHNPMAFPAVRTRSMSLMTLMGYVVVEPDCPIFGEQGRMNDNYVPDLRNNLWATIDELDKRNIIDRDRLAIGGHSYGAFSTANALAHTPFFKAGIAGDGNYNRTLTPMSFQSERRNIWDARETYFTMSPLLWANQVNGALLMYHGADDANTGTFPINSPRMFQALNGLDKDVSLYVYPYEGHGPGAGETIHDLWARWVEWLDIYVKDPSRSGEMYATETKLDLTEDK